MIASAIKPGMVFVWIDKDPYNCEIRMVIAITKDAGSDLMTDNMNITFFSTLHQRVYVFSYCYDHNEEVFFHPEWKQTL
jgi:hypothetical protein